MIQVSHQQQYTRFCQFLAMAEQLALSIVIHIFRSLSSSIGNDMLTCTKKKMHAYKGKMRMHALSVHIS